MTLSISALHFVFKQLRGLALLVFTQGLAIGTALAAPTISVQPVSTAVASGASTRLSITWSSSSNPVTVQWYLDGVPLANGRFPNASTNYFFDLYSVRPSDAGVYVAKLTSPDGSVETNPVTVTVLPPARLELPMPDPLSHNGGYSAEINVSNSGATPPFTYQWFKNGAAIPGQTSARLDNYTGVGNYSGEATNAAGVSARPDIHVWLSAPAGASTWLDSYQQGSIVYFLAVNPGRILRYDLIQEAWLPAVTLGGSVQPTAFQPTTSGVFVAYGATLVRRSLDLLTETPVTTAGGSISLLFNFDNLVYFYDSGLNREIAYHQSTLAAAFAPQFANSAYISNGRPALSATLRRGFASADHDLVYFAINGDGTISNPTEIPFASAFAHNNRAYLSPDEQFVFDNGGGVYSTTELKIKKSIGVRFDALAFLSDGSAVTLRDDVVAVHAPSSFAEQGQYKLPTRAFAVFSRTDSTFAFGAAPTVSDPPTVTKILRTAFLPPAAGTNPATFRRFSIDDVSIDAEGVVNIVSRSTQGVVRWSTQTQTLLSTIPLRGRPSVASFSTATNQLFLGYADFTVSSVNFSGDKTEHTLGKALGSPRLGLALDNRFAVVAQSNISSGSYATIIDSSAANVYVSNGNYGPPVLWTPATSRLYSTALDSRNGMTWEVLPADSQLARNGSVTPEVFAPLRANSIGTLILSASNGRVVTGELAAAGQIANSVTDAVWQSDGLYTIRPLSVGTEVQQWGSGSYNLIGNLILPGTPLRILPVTGLRFVVVTLIDGYVAFHLVDAGRVLASSWANNNEAPAIVIQPENSSFVANGSRQLAVQATGGLLSYRWRRNGTTIPGATARVLALSGLTSADSGASYDVVVSNAFGSVASSPAILSLSTGKFVQTIYLNSINEKNRADAPFYVDGNASSGLPLTLTVVSGPATINDRTLTITGTGLITIRASQAGDASYEPAAAQETSFMVVKSRPTITLSNLNQTVNGTARTVTATTTPADLPVTVTYNGSSTAPSAAGRYTVLATVNTDIYHGGATGTLTLTPSGNYAPSFLFNPVNTTAIAGETVTFGNLVAATPIVTYQWRRNGVNIPDATARTLTLTAVTTADSGAVFDVVVTNSEGSVTSSAATLTVIGANVLNGSFYETTGPSFSAISPSNTPANLVSALFLPDGKFLISGQFSSVNNVPVSTPNQFLRLNTDGLVDSGFVPSTLLAVVTRTALAGENKILAGSEAGINPIRGRIALRLTSSGSLDSSYQSPRASLIALAVDSANYTYAIYDQGSNVVFRRLTPDGAIDPSFQSTTQSYQVSAILPLSDGSVLVSRITSASTTNIDRYLHDGTPDSNFVQPSTGVLLGLANMPNGNVVIISRQFAGSGLQNWTLREFRPNGDVLSVFTTQAISNANSTLPLATRMALATILQERIKAASPGAAAAVTMQCHIFGYYNAVDLDSIMQVKSDGQVLVLNNTGGAQFKKYQLGASTAPSIATQPANQATVVGGSATFSVSATAVSALTYQWRRNGVNLSGQTGSTLALSGLSLSDSGAQYDVVVTAAGLSVTSDAATLTVVAFAAENRVYFGTIVGGGSFAIYVSQGGDAVMIGTLPNGRGSFAIKFRIAADGSFSTNVVIGNSGSSRSPASKTIRADATAISFSGQIAGGGISGTTSAGDTLTGTVQSIGGASAAYAGYYEAPVLNSAGAFLIVIAGSDGTTMVASSQGGIVTVGSGTISASGQISASLGGGPTIQGRVNSSDGSITGELRTNGVITGGFSGVSATTTHTDRLVNISTRGLVGDGDKAMFAGFVITGAQPKSVLVRASGPTLATYGLGGTMDNPVLKIYKGDDVIASNDDWSTAADAATITATSSRLGAFALLTGSKDAALITTLAPGIYSAQVNRAAGSSPGLAIVEVYDASTNPGTESQKVVNISTRGQIGTGESIMIAGFVITGNVPKKVLIRGVGPTLGNYGVGGTLADPKLTLYKGATVIASNDDWSVGPESALLSAAALQVGGFALLPESKDAALLITLEPGIYSAQVAGIGDTTGVALLEVYEVP